MNFTTEHWQRRIITFENQCSLIETIDIVGAKDVSWKVSDMMCLPVTYKNTSHYIFTTDGIDYNYFNGWSHFGHLILFGNITTYEVILQKMFRINLVPSFKSKTSIRVIHINMSKKHENTQILKTDYFRTI